MAFVTDTFDFRYQPDVNIGKSFLIKGGRNLLRVAIFVGAGLLAGTCLIAAVGTIEAVLPAFISAAPAMRRLPTTMPPQLAIVDHQIGRDHIIRERFVQSYTADAAYSNLDWHRNSVNADTDIIADIGSDGIIEEQPAVAMIIEPRAERVPFTPASDTNSIVAMVPDDAGSTLDVPDHDAIPIPSLAPDQSVLSADVKTAPELFLPDDVPLPTRKPLISKPRKQDAPQLAYAPETGRTEEPKREGIFSPLFRPSAQGRTAIYDISAATVYLPNGEKLEAHSGIGGLRDNPRSVTQKNRGATPPHTYNLRMREALFHGVAAIRLTPVDGRNPHNRDGLLAHTYMLGRNGDSNGCVVFKDYVRFLRAFQRGEFNQLVVVASLSSKTSRVASLF